jgi:hypothetical protein
MLEAEQLHRMSMAERLRALEQRWDAVCRDDTDVVLPDWHAAVLEDPKARAARGEARFLTLDQVRARLRAGQP